MYMFCPNGLDTLLSGYPLNRVQPGACPSTTLLIYYPPAHPQLTCNIFHFLTNSEATRLRVERRFPFSASSVFLGV